MKRFFVSLMMCISFACWAGDRAEFAKIMDGVKCSLGRTSTISGDAFAICYMTDRKAPVVAICHPSQRQSASASAPADKDDASPLKKGEKSKDTDSILLIPSQLRIGNKASLTLQVDEDLKAPWKAFGDYAANESVDKNIVVVAGIAFSASPDAAHGKSFKADGLWAIVIYPDERRFQAWQFMKSDKSASMKPELSNYAMPENCMPGAGTSVTDGLSKAFNLNPVKK